MSRQPDPFPAVLEALAADSTTPCGEPGAAVELIRRIDGPFSTVCRARITSGESVRHVYIKVMKRRSGDPDEAAMLDRMLRREYRATGSLYGALQADPEISAVRPLVLLADHRAIVTEEVAGRPLSGLLTGGRTPVAALRRIVRNVGRWIRLYQSVIPADGEVNLAERRAYIDLRLEALEARCLPGAERRAALKRFDELCSELGRTTVPAVAIHADLTPANVLVDNGGVMTVLDFTMAKSGTVYHDLAHFYLHLGLMASRHRTSRPVLESLQEALLEGYGGALADDPLFRLMLLQHSACHVALLAERRLPVVDSAYRWFLRRRWRVCEQLPVRGAARQVA